MGADHRRSGTYLLSIVRSSSFEGETDPDPAVEWLVLLFDFLDILLLFEDFGIFGSIG